MDPSMHAMVAEIVSHQIAETWSKWLLVIAVLFIAAFFGAYVRRRAENLATRDDFKELKRQLEATTRMTEDIKREIGHAEWKAREVNAILRAKLEEMVRQLTIINREIRRFVDGDSDQVALSTIEIESLRGLMALYFPSLREAVNSYVDTCMDMLLLALAKKEHNGTHPDIAGQGVADHIRLEIARVNAANTQARGTLERSAADFMAQLLEIPK